MSPNRAKRRLTGPPCFADDHHRRNHDTLIERRCTARMWLRAQGRLPLDRAAEIPPVIAQQLPIARQLRTAWGRP